MGVSDNPIDLSAVFPEDLLDIIETSTIANWTRASGERITGRAGALASRGIAGPNIDVVMGGLLDVEGRASFGKAMLESMDRRLALAVELRKTELQNENNLALAQARTDSEIAVINRKKEINDEYWTEYRDDISTAETQYSADMTEIKNNISSPPAWDADQHGDYADALQALGSAAERYIPPRPPFL